MLVLRSLFTVAFTCFLIVGCAQRPTTDYRTDYDFSSLRSFSMLPVDKTVFANPKVSEIQLHRIASTLARELAKRYIEVPEDSADFLVRYEYLVEDRIDYPDTTTSFSVFRGGFGYQVGVQPLTNERHYLQGTIIVDILDAKTKEVIWRGSIERKVKQHRSPEERQAYIDQHIIDMFENFPPR